MCRVLRSGPAEAAAIEVAAEAANGLADEPEQAETIEQRQRVRAGAATRSDRTDREQRAGDHALCVERGLQQVLAGVGPDLSGSEGERGREGAGQV